MEVKSIFTVEPLFWVLKAFCRTGLPLARIICVWSTLLSHSPLSSNQGCWWTSTTSIIFPQKSFGGLLEIEPGLLGEKQVCYLCAMQPPLSPKAVLFLFLLLSIYLEVSVGYEAATVEEKSQVSNWIYLSIEKEFVSRRLKMDERNRSKGFCWK